MHRLGVAPWNCGDIQQRQLESAGFYSPNIDALSVYKGLRVFSSVTGIPGFKPGNRFNKGHTVFKRTVKVWTCWYDCFIIGDSFCLYLFTRIGWIPPKRLKSKSVVSVEDRHCPHLPTPPLRYTLTIVGIFSWTSRFSSYILVSHSWLLDLWFFCQVLPSWPICSHRRHHQVSLIAAEMLDF